MTMQDYRKLLDLYLDDELPLELVLDFKEAMFSNPELSAEVSEARRSKEALADAFSDDRMTPEEHSRIYAKLVATYVKESEMNRSSQLGLPLSDQLQLPIHQG